MCMLRIIIGQGGLPGEKKSAPWPFGVYMGEKKKLSLRKTDHNGKIHEHGIRELTLLPHPQRRRQLNPNPARPAMRTQTRASP